jgi:hypothetical protein
MIFEGVMVDKKKEMVRFFRQLNPENQNMLFACIRAAQAAENAVKKSFVKRRSREKKSVKDGDEKHGVSP